MSEYCDARIQIGGSIKRSIVPQLCERISEEHVGLDYGENSFGPTTEQDLMAAIGPRSLASMPAGTLMLFADEAYYGEFTDLEEFLRDNQIPFNRTSGSCNECFPCLRIVRPGAEDIAIDLDASGNRIVKVMDVKNIADALKSALERGNGFIDPLELSIYVDKLSDLGSIQDATLPEFVIVDG